MLRGSSVLAIRFLKAWDVILFIFLKTKVLYSYTSVYNYATSDVGKKYFALSTIRYDFEDGGFY